MIRTKLNKQDSVLRFFCGSFLFCYALMHVCLLMSCGHLLGKGCHFSRLFQGGASLWTIFVISVLFCYAFTHVCLLMPCGHLLGKG